MRHSKLIAAWSAAGLLAAAAWSRAGELPKLAVPDGAGVNIHFTDPRPGEMKMLAEAGFRWVRMDFAWSGIEREKGKYDFSAYDRLMAALEPHKIRALLILDYSNRHYDNGLSPASDDGRKAFARWAAAGARHFRGRGILWEMYNEPNIGFWKPQPDVKQYIQLALEVGKALREAAPEEMYIGPATSQIDLPFLEECFKAGLLEYWSAVSVHPYRQTPPETAAAEYAALRQLIAKYAPKGKSIPILSGEWGYSSVWKNFDEAKQGKFLPRQWLMNLANDVPLSIWYDWHDDGPDPKEPEHHFGAVFHEYRAGRDPVYDPKPAYRAAKTLTTVLGGYAFSKRLMVDDEQDHVLLFTRGDDVAVAAWTTAPTPSTVLIPASPGRFNVTSHTGETLPAVAAHSKGLSVILTDSPQYFVPDLPNDLLRVAAAWERAPLEVVVRGPQKAEVATAIRNPLGRSIRVIDSRRRSVTLAPGESGTLVAAVDVLRTDQPVAVRLVCQVDQSTPLVQTTRVLAANPLRLSVGPPVGKAIRVRVENPSGEAMEGSVRWTEVRGLRLEKPAARLHFRSGETEKDVDFPLQDGPARDFQFGLRVEDAAGRLQAAWPAAPMALVDDFSRYTPETLARAWRLVPDGDPKVASEQSVAVADLPAGPGAAGGRGLKIAYRMDKGWKFIRLAPQSDALRKIDGRPKTAAMWIYGDGSGNHLRLRFVGADGQTFQPSGPSMDFKGWRLVTMAMDGSAAGHWGGKDDGVVRYPIRWDSLLLIDSTRRETGPLEVFVGSPVLIYPEEKTPTAQPEKQAAGKKKARGSP